MKEIPLTQGKVALVDNADFNWLNQWNWHLSNGYASRWGMGGRLHRRRINMHQQIMQPPDGMEVDHVDFDRLNCQRYNLRLCTRQQNQANRRKAERRFTSRFKGVNWVARDRRWRAGIRVGKATHLGYFADEVSAALAYDKAAREHFGEFARLNFPSEETLEKEPS